MRKLLTAEELSDSKHLSLVLKVFEMLHAGDDSPIPLMIKYEGHKNELIYHCRAVQVETWCLPGTRC